MAAAPPLLFGCGGSSTPPPTTEGNVVLRDQNNYTSQSTLTIPSVQTMPGADLQICWGDIQKDILCHDLTPTTDIDNVSFLRLQGMTTDQIQTKLAAGSLTAAMVNVYRDFHVDHTASSTCVSLSSLSFTSTALNPATDYVEASDKKYLLLFSKGTTPGSGARTMTFIEPTSSSTATAVSAPDGCGSNILHFTADITTPPAVTVPKAGPWDVDWSLITRDSMNHTVLFQNLDQLMVGFYPGMTVADLQARFLDIDRIAGSSLYQMAIPTGAKHADLANAKDSNGVAFPGFARTDGVWAVAILCSKCQVPAPIILSILEPQ
jgi:hypothetical protein